MKPVMTFAIACLIASSGAAAVQETTTGGRIVDQQGLARHQLHRGNAVGLVELAESRGVRPDRG